MAGEGEWGTGGRRKDCRVMEHVLFKETSTAVKVRKLTGERINISKGHDILRLIMRRV